MLLRTRVALIVVGFLALGLIIALIGTFAALYSGKSRQNEELLTSVGRQAGSIIAARDGTETPLDLPLDTGDLGALWSAGIPGGQFPSFFQIRGPDGRVVQTVSFGATPPVPERARPEPVTADNPDGESFVTVEGEHDGVDWQFRTALLPGGRGTLVVAMGGAEPDDLLRRTLTIQSSVTLVVLVGVGLLAWRTIRRSMRGLEDIAVTADAIKAGDLSRRIPWSAPKSEVGRLGQALNAMLGTIESAFGERAASEARLRRFVADASHELRTPVATIRGYAELFRRGAADRPADLAKAMARIEAEARRMGLLVDELLLLARLDQGRPLAHEPVDLVPLASDAVADAQAIQPDRPLDVEADGPVVVTGDAARLRQVLGNLLANLRAHTPPDAAATVHVHARDGYAVLKVADQGPGLTPEQRERVFERFYRADQGRTGGGAGLGLSIVAAVATAHGGSATITSAPGQGMTVQVTIPLPQSA